jgi:mono/diheme cytochrome c family protein
MIRPLLLAAFVSIGSFAVALPLQSTKPARGGNPEAAKIKNPVASSPDSIAAGRRSYQRLCSRCHGPQGKGDGTGGGSVQPPDLTDDKWDYGGSDGEIFSAIHDGTSMDMEGYAERLTDEDIWNVVNYLRSIGPGK